MKIYVLYHANCMDGFGAAYVAWEYFNEWQDEVSPEDVVFIPVNYDAPPPEMPDPKAIIILDFSYPTQVLESFKSILDDVADRTGEPTGLTILDHHKSASHLIDFQKKYAKDPNVFVNYVLDRSGAMLAWDYFFPKEPTPWLIMYIEDRDLWKWELKNSKEINAAIRSYPMDFQLWHDVFVDLYFGSGEAYAEGKAILRAQDKQVELICKNAEIVSFNYTSNKVQHCIRAAIVNTCLYQSDVGSELLKTYKDIDMAAMYYQKGGNTYWSLRSIEDFDVSKVAKDLGGGGHKNAAGFIVPANTTPNFVITRGV